MVPEHRLESLADPELTRQVRRESTQPATPAAQPVVPCGSNTCRVLTFGEPWSKRLWNCCQCGVVTPVAEVAL